MHKILGRFEIIPQLLIFRCKPVCLYFNLDVEKLSLGIILLLANPKIKLLQIQLVKSKDIRHRYVFLVSRDYCLVSLMTGLKCSLGAEYKGHSANQRNHNRCCHGSVQPAAENHWCMVVWLCWHVLWCCDTRRSHKVSQYIKISF